MTSFGGEWTDLDFLDKKGLQDWHSVSFVPCNFAP